MQTIEEILPALGVQVVRTGEKEISAKCPVHHLVKGRESTRKATWSMNRWTGAWICYTCRASGSLRHLAEMLGHDARDIGKLHLSMLTERLAEVGDYVEEDEEADVAVDEYAFDKNPRPSVKLIERRFIKPQSIVDLNIRWSRDEMCYLLPIYSFLGVFMGWQEKSRGYFNNVPETVKKSHSLFGYQLYASGPLALVESPLDVARMRGVGINAVSSYGVYVSTAQVDALVRAANDIVLALDNDGEGKKETEKLVRILRRRGGSVRRVMRFNYAPAGKVKDPGEIEDDDVLRECWERKLIA